MRNFEKSSGKNNHDLTLEKRIMNMFESTQPDAKNALELENVKKALPRYREILLGREKARFIIARENSLLKKKVDEAYNILKSCELCERRCHVNRAEGKLGICKVGNKPLIS
ncbi:MAG: hypothetical protein Q8O17_04760, partial [Candidatus Methanoperedens sp.]|nr:hypothetical protein [Candidatus Methanoperedens sp.]